MTTPEQIFFNPVGIYPETKSEFTSTPQGFALSFANGWTASVQFGHGNYGSNRDVPNSRCRFTTAATAEIAAMPTEDMFWGDGSRHRLSWYMFDDEQEVAGWCPVGEVMAWLNTISNLPPYNIERDCFCGTCISLALHSIICKACGKQDCRDNIMGMDISDKEIKERWRSQCICDQLAMWGGNGVCPNHSVTNPASLNNWQQENN